MKKKAWLSKTFWAAILFVAVSSYNAISETYGTPAIPNEVYGVLTALGLWGVRTGKKDIE